MWKNKNVILTGCSGGIATALSQKILQKGAVIHGFDLKPGDFTSENFHFHQVDLTDADQLEKQLSEIHGPVDFLLHVAGIMRRGTMLESSEQDYDLIMDINLKSVWLTQKLANPLLSENARILFLSSRHGSHPKVDPALYSLSKNAVWALAEITQKTCPALQVKVAFPGPVDTPLSWFGVKAEEADAKKKMMLDTADIADRLIGLIESDSKYLLYQQADLSYSLGDLVN